MRQAALQRLLSQFRKVRDVLDESIRTIEEELARGEEPDRQVALKPKKSAVSIPPEEEEKLKGEWQRLRDELKAATDPQAHLHGFVHRKSKGELKAFLRANALPIEAKTSKGEMVKRLAQLLKVAETISGGTVPSVNPFQ